MIVPSIKSRPLYGKLAAQPGSSHILVGDGEGGDVLADMAAGVSEEFLSRAHILYMRNAAEISTSAYRVVPLPAASVFIAPTFSAIAQRFVQLLTAARMGTRLYLAGTEGLIGQAMRLALEAGVESASIQTEHRGSLARRVQCVHCKGFIDNVTTQPVRCPHCGVDLFVRDHYSRRLAAFMGVCIDAEEPGVLPPVEEAFK